MAFGCLSAFGSLEIAGALLLALAADLCLGSPWRLAGRLPLAWPGDQDPGVSAEAALVDPTGTGEFRPYRGLRPTHRRQSLTSLPKQTRAPLHDPARCRLPFGHQQPLAR